MLVISEKDRERAKGMYKMSSRQKEAALDRIKDPVKMLQRGMAMADMFEFEASSSADTCRKHNEFCYRAIALGAKEEDIEQFIEFNLTCYKKFQKIRDDRTAKKREELWASVPKDLTQGLCTNTWCDYSVKIPGCGRRIVDIFHSIGSGDYYCDIRKTSRSKNTTRIYLGNDKGKYGAEVTAILVDMIKKYEIMDPYKGDHNARVNRRPI